MYRFIDLQIYNNASLICSFKKHYESLKPPKYDLFITNKIIKIHVLY